MKLEVEEQSKPGKSNKPQQVQGTYQPGDQVELRDLLLTLEQMNNQVNDQLRAINRRLGCLIAILVAPIVLAILGWLLTVFGLIGSLGPF